MNIVWHKQAYRFLLVGGCATIISYSTFLISLRIIGLHYLIANFCGFIVSIGFSYYCNSKWTFAAQERGYFYRYLSFYLASLIINSLILKFIVEFGGLIPEIANIITIAIVTCINFAGIKLLVFKK